MISIEQFMKLPECKVCHNTGKHRVRMITEEDCEEHGLAPGEEITIQCSACYAQKRRREMFLRHNDLDRALMMYELSDYDNLGLGEKTIDETRLALLETAEILKNIDEFCNTGCFLVVIGATNSGKSTIAHTIARHAALAGYRTLLRDIFDFQFAVSHLREGASRYDDEGKCLYDIDIYTSPDILIFDHFDLVNDFMKYADLKRTNLNLIFKERSAACKPTILLSHVELRDLFPVDEKKQALRKHPYDLYRWINKDQRKLKFNGKFRAKPRCKAPQSTDQGQAGAKGRPARVKIAKK